MSKQGVNSPWQLINGKWARNSNTYHRIAFRSFACWLKLPVLLCWRWSGLKVSIQFQVFFLVPFFSLLLLSLSLFLSSLLFGSRSLIMEEPSFQPIITLYDAVTDSPVFRSSVYRYDQQLEHLEHWLDSLSRHLKLYTEKLNSKDLDTLLYECVHLVNLSL